MKRITYFDNYDTSGYEEEAKEYLSEDGSYEPSDDEIWNAIQDYLQTDYETMSAIMDNAFDGDKLIISGGIGRWNGYHTGGAIYDTWGKFISDFGKDCEYFEIYAENGHLYVRCSHHDGTNLCEVKTLTDAGDRYYDNWNYGVDPRTDKYTEAQVINRLFSNSKYAKRPIISMTDCGCIAEKKRGEQMQAKLAFYED